MRLRAAVLIILLGIATARCDSAEDPPPVLQGRFEGTFMYIAEPGPFSPGGPVSQPWALTLQENTPGIVTGTGSLDRTPVTVTGTHDHPNVTLEFTDDQAAFAGRFTGTLSRDGRVLDGVYNFTFFFVNNPVMLVR